MSTKTLKEAIRTDILDGYLGNDELLSDDELDFRKTTAHKEIFDLFYEHFEKLLQIMNLEKTKYIGSFSAAKKKADAFIAKGIEDNPAWHRKWERLKSYEDKWSEYDSIQLLANQLWFNFMQCCINSKRQLIQSGTSQLDKIIQKSFGYDELNLILSRDVFEAHYTSARMVMGKHKEIFASQYGKRVIDLDKCAYLEILKIIVKEDEELKQATMLYNKRFKPTDKNGKRKDYLSNTVDNYLKRKATVYEKQDNNRYKLKKEVRSLILSNAPDESLLQYFTK